MAHVTHAQLIDEIAIATNVPRATVAAALRQLAHALPPLIAEGWEIEFAAFGRFMQVRRGARMMKFRNHTTLSVAPWRTIPKFRPHEYFLDQCNPPPPP